MPCLKQSQTITEQQTPHERQKELSVSLHKFSRLWAGARSRVEKAARVADYMRHNDIVSQAPEFEPLRNSLRRIEYDLNTQEKRIEDLDATTKVLVNLVRE